MADTREVSERQRCEVYSRVVGYLRPIAQFNVGQQQQFRDRKVFVLGLGPETGALPVRLNQMDRCTSRAGTRDRRSEVDRHDSN